MKSSEQLHDCDPFMGLDPVRLAKGLIIKGLREHVAGLAPSAGIISENDLEAEKLPDSLMIPSNHSAFSFRLAKDTRKRLFIIIIPNTENGEPDFCQRGTMWQHTE